MSSNYESEVEATDDEESQPLSKAKKVAGAATYKLKFNPAWIKDYPFIASVPHDPSRYYNDS